MQNCYCICGEDRLAVGNEPGLTRESRASAAAGRAAAGGQRPAELRPVLTLLPSSVLSAPRCSPAGARLLWLQTLCLESPCSAYAGWEGWPGLGSAAPAAAGGL